MVAGTPSSVYPNVNWWNYPFTFHSLCTPGNYLLMVVETLLWHGPDEGKTLRTLGFWMLTNGSTVLTS